MLGKCFEPEADSLKKKAVEVIELIEKQAIGP